MRLRWLLTLAVRLVAGEWQQVIILCTAHSEKMEHLVMLKYHGHDRCIAKRTMPTSLDFGQIAMGEGF